MSFPKITWERALPTFYGTDTSCCGKCVPAGDQYIKVQWSFSFCSLFHVSCYQSMLKCKDTFPICKNLPDLPRRPQA